jgi:hypothetical protein
VAKLRVHGASIASKPTLRVHGTTLAGSVVPRPKLRVHDGAVVGDATANLQPLADVTVEPQEPVTIATALTAGSATPDSYLWRVVSGTPVSLAGAGASLTFTSPSAMPPLGATTVLGVRAVVGGFTSPEVQCTVTTRPQLSWSRVPGGQWVGSKPRVTV